MCQCTGMSSVPPKSISTLHLRMCNPLATRSLQGELVKMKSPCIRMDPTFNDCVLIRRPRAHRGKDWGDVAAKPGHKDCQHPPTPGGGKGRASREPAQSMALTALGLRAQSLQNYERINLCCFKTPSLCCSPSK